MKIEDRGVPGKPKAFWGKGGIGKGCLVFAKKYAVLPLVLLMIFAFAAAASAASAYEEAASAYARGHYRKAISLLEGNVKKNPSAGAYYLLGYSSYKLRRYRKAGRYFKKAYQIDPHFKPESLKFPALKGGTRAK